MSCPPSPPSLGEMLGSLPELGDLGGDKNYYDSFFHTLIKQCQILSVHSMFLLGGHRLPISEHSIRNITDSFFSEILN
jgi:hypothetical protein